MRKLCAMALVAAFAAAALFSAFAMTEEEVLAAVAASADEYAPGSPLTLNDFLVFETADTLEAYDGDALTAIKAHEGFGLQYSPNTAENLVPEGEGDRVYTYRGISVTDRRVDPALYSRQTVLEKYGAAVSGDFDPDSDAFYRFCRESNPVSDYGKPYIEIIGQSVSYLLYTFQDIGQIKFCFDADGELCALIYYSGVQEYADRAAVRRAQEFLNRSGYSCGAPDGVAGANTRAAIEAFQADHGMFVSGFVDDSLMKFMEAFQ